MTFTELRGFHRAFATGVACQQGALTLSDTWFRPSFLDLLMLQLLRPNSSNLPCLYSTFHLEYPLVLSRFCLSHRMYNVLSNTVLKIDHAIDKIVALVLKLNENVTDTTIQEKKDGI